MDSTYFHYVHYSTELQINTPEEQLFPAFIFVVCYLAKVKSYCFYDLSPTLICLKQKKKN